MGAGIPVYKDIAPWMWDEFVEFPEDELEFIRTKVWTVSQEEANRRWYLCIRKTGQNDPSSCLEEGEAVRHSHIEQQKALDESGCEEAYFRFGRCYQMAQWRWQFCRDFQKEFRDCVRESGKVDLYTPPIDPLKVPIYTGNVWTDARLYKAFVKKRREFLHENPRFYLKMNIETMNPEELYDYINDLKYTDNEAFSRHGHSFLPNYAVPDR